MIYEIFDKYPIGMLKVLETLVETLNMSKVYSKPGGGF